MAGALTVTLVGTYKDLADAIAAWDAGTDTTPTTDSHELHQLQVTGAGQPSFALIKILKAP